MSLVSEIVLLWKLTCSLKHDDWKTRSLFRVHVILHHWQLLLYPLKKQVGLTSSHLISLHLSSDTKRQKDTQTSTNASTHIIWFYHIIIDLNLSHRIHVGYMKGCFCQDKRIGKYTVCPMDPSRFLSKKINPKSWKLQYKVSQDP